MRGVLIKGPRVGLGTLPGLMYYYTVARSWPSALPTLCSTHCSPTHAILPNSRTLDGYPLIPSVKTGQQLYRSPLSHVQCRITIHTLPLCTS